MENEVILKKYSPSGSFVNQNAKCSEDEFDPLEKHKKRAETKAVFLDMEINFSSSDDSDCFLDSKAKLHSRKTINESNQSQKTVVASEIDEKNERIRTTGYYCEHVIDLNKVAALGLRFGRVFFQSYSYLLEWNKHIEVGDWIFNFIESHDLIYCLLLHLGRKPQSRQQ